MSLQKGVKVLSQRKKIEWLSVQLSDEGTVSVERKMTSFFGIETTREQERRWIFDWVNQSTHSDFS